MQLCDKAGNFSQRILCIFNYSILTFYIFIYLTLPFNNCHNSQGQVYTTYKYTTYIYTMASEDAG